LDRLQSAFESIVEQVHRLRGYIVVHIGPIIIAMFGCRILRIA